MRQTSILIFSVCLFSCNDSNQKKEPVRNFVLQYDPFKIDYFSFVNNITDINTLIAVLNNNEDLEGKAVGITGERTLSYTYFRRLMSVAPDSTLVRLTHHTNPKLRVYGMWALAANNKPLALNQLKRFRNDTTCITYHSGCITLNLPVYSLVETYFDSTEIALNAPQKKLFILSKD